LAGGSQKVLVYVGRDYDAGPVYWRKMQVNAPAEDDDLTPALMRWKPVWFAPGEPVNTPCYARHALQPGHRFTGPAIVLQYDTTVVVAPGWAVEVDPALNLWLIR